MECEGQAKTFLGASPENERHTTPRPRANAVMGYRRCTWIPLASIYGWIIASPR